MADQYFSRKPASRRAPSEFQVTIRGHAFTFLTDAGVFSRGSPAPGPAPPAAPPLPALPSPHLLAPPPIRAGRSIVDRIVHEAPAHLLDGGSLWIVARTRQGADAIRARMERAFGNVAVVRRGSGYKVLRSTKATTEAGTVVGPGTGSGGAFRAEPGG